MTHLILGCGIFSQIANGNRIYQGVEGDQKYEGWQGDISVSVYDADNNAIVLRPDPYTVTDGCILRPNWNMAVCPHKYGKVSSS